jgi:BCD family chlorophyll transporter-like MFS transporter
MCNGVKPLSWVGIVRLGLVQSALGAVVALATSTLNRVMVVEMGVSAALPAALIAWHYAVQLSRPRWGHGSDLGHRRTPWIIGGVGVMAIGAIIAADATLMMGSSPVAGFLMALVAFSMIGAGVGASGTSLLALLATRVAPERRPAAASTTWLLMIVGIVVSTIISGALLQPFSAQRLALVASGVAAVAFLVTLLAVWGSEGPAPQGFEAETSETPAAQTPAISAPRASLRQAMAEIWADPMAKRFTIFVFVSMLAYSAQELILEPFAGLVFGLTPGQSTQLTGLQHGGVLLGMIMVGLLGARFGDRKSLWMRRWTMGGCIGSAVALGALGLACLVGPTWPLAPTVFGLGFANGVFAVSAIGSMMGLASGKGGTSTRAGAGVRMGVWGAAQAGAFAIGGFLGAIGVDLLRHAFHQPAPAFLCVFIVEAGVFLASAILASRLDQPAVARPTHVANLVERPDVAIV